MERVTGILSPVASLPSRHGIGDFGKESYRFAELSAKAGFRLWQVLPLNPLGYGHSPYQPFSSYAIDELYCDLDALKEEGLIKGDIPDFAKDSAKILYEEIRDFKLPYLHEAFASFMKKRGAAKKLEDFRKEEEWATAWGLFMMNKRKEFLRSWTTWEKRRQRMNEGKVVLTPEEKDDFDFEIWLQMTLYSQWRKLLEHCHALGLRIVGDVPFYVGHDSSDVWANLEYFLIDPKTKEPTFIAGVPPDYFSATGQRWGNPMYNWDYLEMKDFSFLTKRLIGNAKLYDIVRLDHFRAFDTYWKIPASCPTAIEGVWNEAPGYKFFDTLLKEAPGIEIIAEDLGDLRKEVLVLRDHYDFPGMNVVQFTFHDAEIAKTDDRDRENMVAYLGTHDNQTIRAYYEELPEGERKAWDEALSSLGIPEGDITERAIRYELSLKAKYAIFAVQDLLGLGDEARLNKPGIVDDVNWTWRMKDYEELEERLPHLTDLMKEYGRLQ